MKGKKIYILIAVIAIAAILFFVLRSLGSMGSKNKYTGPQVALDKNKFIADFKSWLKKKEGGVSRDKDDSASHYSWPNGEHTNIGITRRTFENNASKCGYQPTYEVWRAMPPGVWWCNYQQFLNEGMQWTDNFILGVYMSQWYWGAWVQEYVTPGEINQVLRSGLSDRDKLYELVQLRKKYFEIDVKHNSKNKKYLAGWEEKADEFYNKYSKYLAA